MDEPFVGKWRLTDPAPMPANPARGKGKPALGKALAGVFAQSGGVLRACPIGAPSYFRLTGMFTNDSPQDNGFK